MDFKFSSLVKEVSQPAQEPAQQPATGEAVKTVERKASDIQPPLDKYSEVKGQPYSVDYFGIDYYKALNGELDVNKIIPKIKDIEKFVKDEIAAKKYDNTIESYKDIIDNIKSLIGINKNVLPEIALSRVSEYIKLLNKQRGIEKKRTELLNGKYKD